MGLSTGAVAMLLLVSFVLYGGLLYFVIIALGRDPIRLLPEPLRGFLRNPTNRYGTVLAIVILLLIPALGSGGYREEEHGGGSGGGEILTETFGESGTLQEGETHSTSFDTGGYVLRATFTLTWEDEPDAIGRENRGDTFTLRITAPTGEEREDTMTNDHGSPGEITIRFDLGGLDVSGPWAVNVTLDDAGDQEVILIGYPVTADDGNSFSLDVSMDYRP